MKEKSGSKLADQWRGLLGLVVSVLLCIIAVIVVVLTRGEIRETGKSIETLRKRFDDIEGRLALDDNDVGETLGDDVIGYQSHVINKRDASFNRLCRGPFVSAGRQWDDLVTQTCRLSRRMTRLEHLCRYMCPQAVAHVVLSTAYPPMRHENRLVWQWSNDHVFDWVAYEFGESYSSIVVSQAGMFTVSVQVTFNGREGPRETGPCAVMVKKRRQAARTNGARNYVTTDLLYAASTQYELGQEIEEQDGYSIRAYDTVMTSGVVRLCQHDEVFVEPVSPECKILDHPDKTSLQLIRLKPVLDPC